MTPALLLALLICGPLSENRSRGAGVEPMREMQPVMDSPSGTRENAVGAILSCAVAPPSQSFTHPPLFGGDLTLFHSMVTLITEHNGYRMLVVGPTRNWILSLRLEGIRAFGIAEEPWSWDPFYVVAKYGDMPFRSSAFKVISVVAEGGVALIFEADRLLVPSGFLTLQTYDEFRMYGLLKRLGYSFVGHSVAGQHVWQKRDWESA